MNREEAKFILGAYRTSGQDAEDPQFKEALALAKEDPELAAWFSREQAMDAIITKKIRSLPTPAGLKAELLAARKTVRIESWWRSPAWRAIAASVALLLSIGGLMVWRNSRESSFAQFRHTMVEASLDMQHHLDVSGLGSTELKQWLAEHHGESAFVLPKGLEGKTIGGCKVLDWHGNKVTLLCFMFDGKHEDMFVLDATAPAGWVSGDSRKFTLDGNVTTVVWKQENQIYLLAGNMDKNSLKSLF